jgi:hypothetical protein
MENCAGAQSVDETVTHQADEATEAGEFAKEACIASLPLQGRTSNSISVGTLMTGTLADTTSQRQSSIVDQADTTLISAVTVTAPADGQAIAAVAESHAILGTERSETAGAGAEADLWNVPVATRAATVTVPVPASADNVGAAAATDSVATGAAADVVGAMAGPESLGACSAADRAEASAVQGQQGGSGVQAPFEGAKLTADMIDAAFEPSLAHHFQDVHPENPPKPTGAVCTVSVTPALSMAPRAAFSVEMSLLATVTELVRVIAQCWNIPEAALTLRHDGQCLQNQGDSLAALGLAAGAVWNIDVTMAEAFTGADIASEVFEGLRPVRVLQVQVRHSMHEPWSRIISNELHDICKP